MRLQFPKTSPHADQDAKAALEQHSGLVDKSQFSQRFLLLLGPFGGQVFTPLICCTAPLWLGLPRCEMPEPCCVLQT